VESIFKMAAIHWFSMDLHCVTLRTFLRVELNVFFFVQRLWKSEIGIAEFPWIHTSIILNCLKDRLSVKLCSIVLINVRCRLFPVSIALNSWTNWLKNHS
jgi:hypothetical protein